MKEVRPLIQLFSTHKTHHEQDAFLQKLYETYDPLLFRVAARYFPDSPQEREDSVQNTWLKVIQNVSKAQEIPKDRMQFWLVCIAKNEAIAILRQQKRLLPLEEWVEPAIGSEYDEFHTVSVLETISAMPETYRAVLELKFVEGFTNREIAKILRISESAVGTRVLRGRALLKEKLTSEGVR